MIFMCFEVRHCTGPHVRAKTRIRCIQPWGDRAADIVKGSEVGVSGESPCSAPTMHVNASHRHIPGPSQLPRRNRNFFRVRCHPQRIGVARDNNHERRSDKV